MTSSETVADRLLRHAREQPGEIAFRIAAGGEQITFGELAVRAGRLASALPNGGVPARIAIACDRPMDFVVALSACFLAGNPCVPLPVALSRRSAPRATAILAEANPELAIVGLTPPGWLVSMLATSETAMLGIDAFDDTRGARPVVSPDATAIVQFSSGSTGNPKGVLLSHANLTTNCSAIATAYALDKHSRGLSWLPLHHDMGLIGHAVAPMWIGCRSTLMDPLRFLQRPLSWLQLASEERTTITSAPNFAYEMCAKAALKGIPSDLSLDCLRVAICGGEPVLQGTVDRFISAFAPFGFAPRAFAPSYGLAEATLLVSTGWNSGGPRFELTEEGRLATNLGRPVSGCSVRILDALGSQVNDGIVGEVEIQGDSVGAVIDHGILQDTPTTLTGDLGFQRDGSLFLHGRKKDLIILRGQNVYPGDLEAAAMDADQAIAPDGLAAIGVDRGGTQELVLLFEVERSRRLTGSQIAALERKVRAKVAFRTGVTPAEVIALRYGTLPRTSSGKIQRSQVAATFEQTQSTGFEGRLWPQPAEALDGLA